MDDSKPYLAGEKFKPSFHTYLAVCEIVDFLTDVCDVWFGLVVTGSPSDVLVGFGDPQIGAFQAHEHRVGQRRVVRFRVVILNLIHPSLQQISALKQMHIWS